MLDAPLIAPSAGSVSETPASALARRVKAMAKPAFAVMDGARFPDLPTLLQERGLSHRSLFLNHADVEVERAGAWLVPLTSDGDTDQVIALMDDMPAAVFWSCPDGEASLHRHLRTVNLVTVPLPRDAEAAAHPTEHQKPAGAAAPDLERRDETVLFRHYDPNVMASLLPLLDAEQFARIFGPASYIVMLAPDYGGLKRAPKPEDLPIAPSGLLRIRDEQMRALEEAREQKSQRKIAAFLRDADPVNTVGMSDAQLRAFVLESEKTGRELGLSSERALGQWAFIMLGSRGHVAKNAAVRGYFLDRADKSSTDDKMSDLLRELGEMSDHAAAP